MNMKKYMDEWMNKLMECKNEQKKGGQMHKWMIKC